MSAVCTPWITPTDFCAGQFDLDDPDILALVEDSIAVAQQWLFRSTCQQFTGVCTSTVRPPNRCGHTYACGCASEMIRYDLSPWVPGPVLTIEQVTVNGDVVDEADYRLVNGAWLVPHRDGALWPWPRQDTNLPDGDEGTWSVTVTHGHTPGADLLEAVSQLAQQLLRKCLTGECDLPDNATSLTGDNGLRIELKVPVKGETGLPFVDSIVDLYPCSGTYRILDPADQRPEITRV